MTYEPLDQNRLTRALRRLGEPGLAVTVPTVAYLLALKLRACRSPLPGYPGDAPDIRFLLGKIKPASLDEVDALFARFFPHDVLTARAREIVETALADHA